MFLRSITTPCRYSNIWNQSTKST